MSKTQATKKPDHQTPKKAPEPDGTKPSETNNLSPKQAAEPAGHLATPKSIDILRVNPCEGIGETRAFRDQLFYEILSHLVCMSAIDLQRVAQFVDVVTHYTGSTSPSEEFLLDALDDHFRYGLTPLLVKEHLPRFIQDFSDMVDATKRVANYDPKALEEMNAARYSMQVQFGGAK